MDNEGTLEFLGYVNYRSEHRMYLVRDFSFPVIMLY